MGSFKDLLEKTERVDAKTYWEDELRIATEKYKAAKTRATLKKYWRRMQEAERHLRDL